jgi:hypothetical protein
VEVAKVYSSGSGRRRIFAAAVTAAAAALAASLAVGGCDRGTSGPKGAAAPHPVTTTPATMPATTTASLPTQPAVTVLNINGHNTIFPAARLRLEQDETGNHLIGLLFTDDPKEALRDNYTGNSFYLRMELNVTDAADLPQAIWDYKAPSAARKGDAGESDSPYGIFLTGRKLQLQPFDVKAKFVRAADEKGGGTTVWMTGQFKVVDPHNDRGPIQVLVVAGEIPVRVDNRVASAQ